MPKRFRVNGNANINVSTEIELTDQELSDHALSIEEYLLEKASSEVSLTNFCGNGGSDKLIGVDGPDDSVNCDEEIEFTTVEPVD